MRGKADAGSRAHTKAQAHAAGTDCESDAPVGNESPASPVSGESCDSAHDGHTLDAVNKHTTLSARATAHYWWLFVSVIDNTSVNEEAPARTSPIKHKHNALPCAIMPVRPS